MNDHSYLFIHLALYSGPPTPLSMERVIRIMYSCAACAP